MAPRKPTKPKPAPKPSVSQPRAPPRNATSLPPNWPPSIQYLTAPRLSPALKSSAVPAVLALNLHAPVPAAAPSQIVKIKPISAPSHPANGQFGLFAARTLPARSWVLDYLGTYHTEAETDARSDYDISLDRESGVGVCARTCGNEGRFVNDYRGVGERANVEFRERRVARGEGEGQMRIAIWVGCRDVRKGEELLVSYGKGFWEGRKDS